MTGSAMRKPRIQPGTGLGQGRLDDRGAQDRGRHRALRLAQGLLGQRLREGVGVGVADRGGPGPARLDQAVVDPALAELLGLLGQQRPAGRAQLGAGRLAEALEPRRGAALGVGVGPQPPGGGHLGPPVDLDVERRGVDQLLGRPAPAAAGHVAGRHGDEVGRGAELAQGRRRCGSGPSRLISTAPSSGESKLTVAAEWMTTSAAASAAAAVVVEAEAVAADVAGDDPHPPLDAGRRSAGLPPTSARSTVEGVVAEQLPPGPLGGRGPPAGADQQGHAGSRARRAAAARRGRCRGSRSTR